MNRFPISSMHTIRRKRLRPWVLRAIECGIAVAIGFALPYLLVFLVEVAR